MADGVEREIVVFIIGMRLSFQYRRQAAKSASAARSHPVSE
jgi:hypothetical protein